MVDVIVIGYAIVGLIIVALGYAGVRKRGHGSAMATLASGALLVAFLSLSITLRLMDVGPWG